MHPLLQTASMFARVVGRLPADHLWYLARLMRHERPHRFGHQVRINSFFPPFPSPAFDRFVDHVIARRRVPYSTYVAITGHCPFHCAHCSHGHRTPHAFTTAQALELVAQVKSLGSCILGLTGGEPLLREDLPRILAAAQPELATILFTTGHGLDQTVARHLAQAGLGCVTLGVESSDADQHDRVRGAAGSFAQARTAAHIARKEGLYLALSTVATRDKLRNGELERIRVMAREWGAGEFRILAPVATGGCAGNTDVMLHGEERQALMDFHVDHNRHGNGPTIACSAYLESAEVFGCGAGFHHLFVDANGEVCPCDLTPLSFGNALTEPLDVIFKRMEPWFCLPRTGCLMARMAPHIPVGPLPLPREMSEALCPRRDPTEPLPGAFKRLLGSSRR